MSNDLPLTVFVLEFWPETNSAFASRTHAAAERIVEEDMSIILGAETSFAHL
jgi:hypothetical protein